MAWAMEPARVRELWRYYQAGLVNAAFGFSVYAILVGLHVDMFIAQAVAHVMGVAFNYITYSRHVFKEARSAKLRFLLSYIANYAVSLAVLAIVSYVIRSAIVAGGVTIVIVSVINYFVLKLFVFRILQS
jgi:putative flippase GtrA